MKRAWLGWIAAVWVAGCGGKVVVDAASTTGTGGAGGGTSSSSGTVGGGGASPQICGGELGFPCAPDEYCLWNPPGTCGGGDESGTCVPKPTGSCPGNCAGVCGCDGVTYCNDCWAHAAGTDVDTTADCSFTDAGVPPVPGYAAFVLPTNAPRYIITKTDTAADSCFFIVASGIGSSQFPDIQVTAGWGVEVIGATKHAKDCALGAGLWPPQGTEVATAVAAKGSLKQDSTSFPCVVSVDIDVAFAASPPWPPSQTWFQTENLPVQGATCPP
ncbi:Kazal-type serine protease inhibitor domain protein [Minicystis rosea]|nr:Kazal-type serine protease inhibitor domain protein [Minicystis rosea]